MFYVCFLNTLPLREFYFSTLSNILQLSSNGCKCVAAPLRHPHLVRHTFYVPKAWKPSTDLIQQVRKDNINVKWHFLSARFRKSFPWKNRTNNHIISLIICGKSFPWTRKTASNLFSPHINVIACQWNDSRFMSVSSCSNEISLISIFVIFF